MKYFSTFVIAVALTLAACGDDAPADGACVTDDPCIACADYGSAAATEQFAESDMAEASTTPDYLGYEGRITDDEAFDLVSIQLYKGLGVFGTGEIVPGTYTITGAEAEYSTCGVCVLIYTDIVSMNETGTPYLATGGTVTITSVSPNLTGSVSNLVLEHVEIDATTFVSTPHADGCDSSLGSLAFDAVVEPAP